MKRTVIHSQKSAAQKRKNKLPKRRLQLKSAVCLTLVVLLSVIGFAYLTHYKALDSPSAKVLSASVITGKSWVPVFIDNFNGGSLDTTHWSAYYNTFGDGNNEEACLTPNNVTVSNGSLKITAKRENITCPGQPQDSFSSGFIGSREKNVYYPAFSRFEIRAKVPHAQGLWPAFWLRHINGSSTAEIDVMEYFHAQVPGRTTQTLHFPNEIGSNVAKKTTSFEAATTQPAWHTWAVEIIPTNAAGTTAKIRMFTDDVLTLEYTPTKFGWLTNYDQSRMFDIAINLAVGGNYSGHPDDALGYSRYTGRCLKPYNGTPPCDASGILRASFPATYEIDYVSVSELRDTPSSSSTVPTTAPPSSGNMTSESSASSGDTTASPGQTQSQTQTQQSGINQPISQPKRVGGSTESEQPSGKKDMSIKQSGEKSRPPSQLVFYTVSTILAGVAGLLGYVFRSKLFRRQ